MPRFALHTTFEPMQRQHPPSILLTTLRPLFPATFSAVECPPSTVPVMWVTTISVPIIKSAGDLSWEAEDSRAGYVDGRMLARKSGHFNGTTGRVHGERDRECLVNLNGPPAASPLSKG
ncbi:hypothetical protein RvY_05284 [Ramazzottius varieornatus]|uniref:Uncharacterized protein n=1 Tax=Ramazzottius varieornatus TaxID=947166 RepID=A0A1D1UUH7_RAMVA|nr:hypothetical protein RvY_05284 [Ramazzottius varieornatus]